jgi:urease gamma subunit
MALTNREKTLILISQAISVYSARMQEGKTSEYQSVIDFISKNIPKEYKSELSIELIDDVFSFVSNNHMELS